jgi:hypothetical protein
VGHAEEQARNGTVRHLGDSGRLEGILADAVAAPRKSG